MSTQFKPLEIPPGVQSKPTKQVRSNAWAEANSMRWVEGQLTPVGGQSQYNYQFATPCRAIHSWYDLQGVFHIAYLCEANLYVDTGGTLTEITPAGGMTGPAPNQDIGYSDGFYSANFYSTNNPIPPISNIPDVWSLDNFGQILLAMTSYDGRLWQWNPSPLTIVYSDTLYSAYGPGSTTINMNGQVEPGVVAGLFVYDSTAGNTIGTVQSVSGGVVTLQAPVPAGMIGTAGNLIQFQDNSPGLATQVTSPDTGTGYAPNGRCFVVTNERFLMIFAPTKDGTQSGGSMRRFEWCDQENFNAWNFSTVTSQAGFLDIEPASPIICAKATPQGILFWTAARTYLSAFLGLPYVYNYTEIAKACTPWSPMSVSSTTILTLWFSEQGMFSYNGAWVQAVPCAVRSWIDDDIDQFNVRIAAFACTVANFNEFWWFFPQEGETSPTRYVIYNFKEGWWSMGTMSRTAGVTATYTVPTIMADGKIAFEHELGNAYPRGTPLPWAETFDLNLGLGARLTTLKQLIPDIGGDVNNLRYSLFYRMSRSVQPDPNGFPMLVQELQTSPRAVNTSNGYVDFRTTARDIRMRIALQGPQVNPVTVGQHLVDATPRGDR